MVFNSLFLIGAKDIWKIPFLRLKKKQQQIQVKEITCKKFLDLI